MKEIGRDADGAIVLEGELLKKYQGYLLSMAADIIGVFEAEGIVYHLGGGSCLGAVRHHGFIPWDDDFDINILGDDFEKFQAAFLSKHADRYTISTSSTPGYGRASIKVRLKDSVFRGKEDDDGDDKGFFIDMYRIENTFDNKCLRYFHGMRCMVYGYLLSCRRLYEKKATIESLIGSNEEARRALQNKFRVGQLFSCVPLHVFAAKTARVYGMCRNSRSKYVCVPSGNKHFFGTVYRREQITQTVKMPFERYEWCVPADYDYYLRNLYRDYMVIPEHHEKHIALELKFPEEMTDAKTDGGKK